MTYIEGIGISIVAAFLVLAIIAMSKALWVYFLNNVWLQLTCRHITDIEGDWCVEMIDADGNKITEEITLRQYGWKIEGIIKYHFQSKAGVGEAKEFRIDGIFRNEMLVAYYWNKNRKQRGCGSFTLKLIKQGDEFHGRYAWYDAVSSEIDTGEYTWKRKNVCP